jgi:hypothetical protein
VLKGVPAPIQAGKRWPVDRTHSWMNGYAKLCRFTDKRKIIIEFHLAAALTVLRRFDQPSPLPLPLANQTHHPTPPLTINCRSF